MASLKGLKTGSHHMSRKHRCNSNLGGEGWFVLASLVMGCIILTSIASAQNETTQLSPLAIGTFRLTVTENKVSLEANKASVAVIFAEIGQRLGIKMNLNTNEIITTRFESVPLFEALKRLAKNIVIITTQGSNDMSDHITKVYVFGKGQINLSQVEESTTPIQSIGTTPSMEQGSPLLVSGDNVPPQTETINEMASHPERFKFTFEPLAE